MAAEKPLPHARCNRARIRSFAKTHSELRQASGHDFSRADKDQTMCRALAPAGFPAAPPRVCANSTHIPIEGLSCDARVRRVESPIIANSRLNLVGIKDGQRIIPSESLPHPYPIVTKCSDFVYDC